MGERPVRVSVLSRETIVIQGNAKRTMKIAIDFMGVEQFAWIGDDATVVKEQGMLGIVLEQVTQKEALSGFLSSSSDLTDIASLAANKILEDPPALTELQVTLTDVDPTLFLDGDRQRFQNGRLTIRKESLKKTAHGDGFDSQDLKPFLEPSPFIQSDHPEIKQQVKNIVSPSDPDVVKAKKLIDWIFKHIEKRPVLSVPNALETLSNRIGDCNEHAALLAAMAQAAGIPAQIEAGLVYQRGRFYYHAWNVLYLGQWVTADAVFGQLPADVTHIRLVRGSQDRQMDLLSSIGRLKINIEDDRK
jgi:transglutaminase-like putative cysteine protease